MFERKIFQEMLQWKQHYAPNYALFLKGARRVGKTTLAEKLGKGHPFLRVDFYNVQGKIYFGELTFFPASGFGKFVPEKWDLTLGSWLELN